MVVPVGLETVSRPLFRTFFCHLGLGSRVTTTRIQVPFLELTSRPTAFRQQATNLDHQSFAPHIVVGCMHMLSNSRTPFNITLLLTIRNIASQRDALLANASIIIMEAHRSIVASLRDWQFLTEVVFFARQQLPHSWSKVSGLFNSKWAGCERFASSKFDNRI